MPSRKSSIKNRIASVDIQPDTRLIPDDNHPDYLPGVIGNGVEEIRTFTPNPDGPLPPVPPLPEPQPPLPPFPPPDPLPRIPRPIPLPVPYPFSFCLPVSGRYSYAMSLARKRLPIDTLPVINLFFITVRIDVDRYFPQNRISISFSRLIPRATAHVIADVTSDVCTGINHRKIHATITYRDGDSHLIPGDQVVFEATKGRWLSYGSYTLTLSGAGLAQRSYPLEFQSRYFDSVDFEVDRVANAGTAVTTYNIGSHSNRPADLPNETISLATVYQRAGFDATMSPNTTVIPNADAGSNGTWSDNEMHNAMITYWSRFANRPQWALWVLFAARHDQGRSLGGIMFDDIGPNHRQGTAIFTDSFIQDVTPGDTNPDAWRQRMVFWTAVHEMGHAFNLAHAWQKAMGVAQGAPGDPWVPLTNQPELRSYMNYPFRVSGGETAFFADFRFRFSDEELLFMRHAPRRFVQMGNSNWFVNHAFEMPDKISQSGRWELRIRPNRNINTFKFLEPVVMELKLTNRSLRAMKVDEDLLGDSRHITIFVQREGNGTRIWKAMATKCHELHQGDLESSRSLYGAHMVSATTDGWLIDEPGFYKMQAAVDMGDEIVVSNVLRLYVAPPANTEETRLAPDYFTEDVARVLAFGGAPALVEAISTLKSVVSRCPKNPAAVHAALAISAPELRDFKRLEISEGQDILSIRSTKADVDSAAKVQIPVLTDDPDHAAETLGHIDYFSKLDTLSKTMVKAGAEKKAKQILQVSVATMKSRNILPSVIKETEYKLAHMK